jgi:glycosyltransferase involved in cell wall biosynthesis
MEDEVDIILAVHNGEEFIEEQIQSILKQTHINWRLIVRDEASSDSTLNIVERYAQKYEDKIFSYHDNRKRGACQNFAKGLELSTANYIMFADCDDYWLPDKIGATLKKMKAMESKHGRDIPMLVFTDLKVVDIKLNVINDSFWDYQNLDPENGKKLNKLLIYNVITGCTMMINRRLKELAVPIPKEAVMHDNWLGMVASAFGKIEYISTPTILYRQHGKNDSGARKYDYAYVIKKALQYMQGDRSIFVKGEQDQAALFLQRYKDFLDKDLTDLMNEFLLLGKRGTIYNKYLIIKNKFYKPGILRNVGLILRA